MDFEFAVTDTPAFSPGISIRSIYHVIADSAYDVKSNTTEKNCNIALRTFWGSGVVSTEQNPDILIQSSTLYSFRFEDIQRYRCADNHWEFWWFQYFSATDNSRKMPSAVSFQEQPGETALMREAVKLLSSPSIHIHEESSAVISRLFSLWKTGAHRESNSTHETFAGLEPALSYMHGHYATPIRIEELARLCNYSVRRFQDLFRAHSGVSPSEYLAEIRLEAAREHLINTNFTLREIAERTGYGNEYYFSRCFRKKYGQPPGAFRYSRRNTHIKTTVERANV
ncbi:MAG: helix-turn-helix transcriptional regulator [Spirochaetales bacterium]|jgi:AraC-like DNA-binding protein|nr:helix-turn-helix transcriptional regulator [Spirochaetales bacterium]